MPSLETTGLVSFNRELGVYIALRFEPGAEISDDTLDTIARTVRLSPADADEAQWDYGPTGKRYPGSFSDRYDFSDTVILDADGSNVTGILLDLWYCASAAYDVDDMVLFPWQDTTTFSDGSVYYDLPDYDRVIRSIFTPEAIEAYEASDVVRIQKTDDGRVWRLGPWKTGYSYAMALSGLQAVSVEPDRMVIRAAYETMDGGIDRDEDPAYVPSYRTVDFTVEKTDGIWYVAEYTYPEEAFRLEQEAAVAAVEAALERLYPGASVDTIAYESDSTDGTGQTIRFRVDYSVGTTGYQNTLWTATCPVRAKPGRLPRPRQSDPPFHSLLPESGTDCSSARFPIKTPRNCHPRQPRGILFSPFSPGRCGKLPGMDSSAPLSRKSHGCVPGPGLPRLFHIFRRPLWKTRRFDATLIIKGGSTMNPKLLLLTLLLALTLAACAPARSEPESGSEASAPSSQAEEQPSEPSSSVQESSADPAGEESSTPESQQPRTLPDWADESFYTAVVDWAGGTRTADSLVERYGDLIVSDRYFRLANEDGSLSGWIELGRDEAVPETVPVEELYQNSARLEQFPGGTARQANRISWYG